jgi:hypothetical protein
MNQLIIYQNDKGGVTVLIPADCGKTIEEIADKDVPAGKSYKIVSSDILPTDMTFFDAWEVDEADLTDGVGAEYNMFLDDPSHPDYVEPTND